MGLTRLTSITLFENAYRLQIIITPHPGKMFALTVTLGEVQCGKILIDSGIVFESYEEVLECLERILNKEVVELCTQQLNMPTTENCMSKKLIAEIMDSLMSFRVVSTWDLK